MNQITGLEVAIIGNSKGLVAAFDSAKAAAASFERNLNTVTARFTGTVSSAFGNVASQVKSFGATMVTAAAAYGTFAAVADAFERADTLSKTAASLGMTVEQLQRLQQAAIESGGSMQGMSSALQKMSLFISEASDGGSQAAETLRAFGLRADELKRIGTEEAFYRIVDSLNAMESVQDRLAVSQAIFGREARNMAEVVAMGSAGIREAGAAAEKTGRVLSSLDTSRLKEAGDEVQKLKERLAATSSAAIAKTADDFSFMAREASKATEATGSVSLIMQGLTKAMALVVAVALDLWRVVDLAFTALKGLGNGIGYALSLALEKATEAFTYIGRAVPGLVDLFAGMSKAIWGSFAWLFQAVKAGFLELFKWLSMTVAGKMRSIGELMAEFNIAGGESLAQLGLDFENWAMTVDTDVKAGMDSASGRVKVGTDQMRQALAALSNTSGKSGVSAWFADIKEGFAEATLETTAYFNKISSESSIHNLVKDWFGVGEAIDAANEKASGPAVDPVGAKAQAPAMRVSSEDDVKRIDELKAKWEEMYRDVGTVRAEFERGIAGPIAAEQMAYDQRRAMLEAFNAEEIGLQQEKMKALEDLQATHNAKIASLDLDNQAMRLNQQINYSDLSLSERYDAFDQMRALHEEKYAQEQEVINKAWQDKRMSDEAAFAAHEAAYLRHQQNMTTVTQQEAQMRMAAESMVLGAMGNMFGQFAAAMDQKKRKEFYMWKAFSIAQAVISTYLAATNAMASAATFGPGAAIAATTMIVAAGLANVARIAATQYQGATAGGGGAGAGAGGSESSQIGGGESRNVSGMSNVNVTLYGSNFSADQVRGLIGAINEQAGDNMTLKAQVAS